MMNKVKNVLIGAMALTILGLGAYIVHLQAVIHDVEIVVEDVAEHNNELEQELNAFIEADMRTQSGDSNVGDGNEYQYEVTEVTEDDIHGVPANVGTAMVSEGILLYPEEVEAFGVEVSEGDIINVVWGEQEDEFESIEIIAEGR